MPDLRDDLGRLADFVGEPRGLDDLAAARRRRERRRRAGGLVVGLAVIVAAAAFLATTLQERPGVTPAAVQGAYVPPGIPYVWPENWTDPTGARRLADAQAAATAGDPNARWRTNPTALATRFVSDVLHWGDVAPSKVEQGPGGIYFRFVPPPSIAGLPGAANISVHVVQPTDATSSGVWSVQSVSSDLLSPSGASLPAANVVVPGSPITFENDLPSSATVALGAIVRNGCFATGAPREGSTLLVPSLGGVADRAGDCGSLGAGTAWAYAVADGTPTGYPFSDASQVVALSLFPFVVDGNAPAPTVSPIAGTSCGSAPLSEVTIVGQNLTLDGCGSWMAGHQIDLTFNLRDPEISMELALFPASSCDANGCSGKPTFTADIVTGPDTTTYHLDALEPGSYVLLDQVHPVSARLEITVG